MSTALPRQPSKKLIEMQKMHEPEAHPLISIVPPLQPAPLPLPKRQKIILDHKVRAKNSAIDWICFVVYILSLYGFLVLMIYLLLKATKDDSQATGIAQFAIFMFFTIVLVVFVLLWQRKQKKEEREDARKRELVAD